jgi:acetyltransferase-like isoleucine patch superfamily enzyme
MLSRFWHIIIVYPALILTKILVFLPYFKFVKDTQNQMHPITFRTWFWQKIIGFNRQCYWPTHFTTKVIGTANIVIGKDSAPGYNSGCYIQGLGKIFIGDYTLVAPNVGIISANHDIYNTSEHIYSEVRIGSYCWLGMGSTVLPGVELGDFTIVAAGAVVNKSFPEGYCVIGGIPAKVIKHLEKEKCVRFESKSQYHGYIPDEKFDAFRKKALKN